MNKVISLVFLSAVFNAGNVLGQNVTKPVAEQTTAQQLIQPAATAKEAKDNATPAKQSTATPKKKSAKSPQSGPASDQQMKPPTAALRDPAADNKIKK